MLGGSVSQIFSSEKKKKMKESLEKITNNIFHQISLLSRKVYLGNKIMGKTGYSANSL